ncbi:hypothetical protein AURDEDRAFT_31925, partial [Auricularia subglabra TFB-10046 SS5]
ATYELELPRELMARGINPSFHASYLRIFNANEDSRFPGREQYQLEGFRTPSANWVIDEIVDHYGKGKELLFKVKWSTGHET